MRGFVSGVFAASLVWLWGEEARAESILAAEPLSQAVLDQMHARILRQPEQSKKGFIGQVLSFPGGGYVTAERIETQIAVQAAQRRAGIISSLYLVDLNADGRVSQSEVDEVIAFGRPASSTARDALLALPSHDLNADGALDFEEVMAFVTEQDGATSSSSSVRRRYQLLLAMDMDADGRTSIAEVVAYIDALVAAEQSETKD